MSILHVSDNACLIDHGLYLSRIYKTIEHEGMRLSYLLRPELFYIIKDKNQTTRKRSHNAGQSDETLTIKDLYYKFKLRIPSDLKNTSLKTKYKLENQSVRDISKQLFESTVFEHNGMNGGNTSDVPIRCAIKMEDFLIPPKSRFFCGCVKEQCQKLDGVKFDIVIADPPWWNKYIRRLKSANDKLGYSMMYNEDIASIPVKGLLSENCLVAVWCTNSPSNIAAVKDLIFPSWGVEYLTTWYWLKVTVDLEPMCDFASGCKKQPYERLILGKVGTLKCIPDTRLFMSIPSALHSHKPPILDLLSPYVEKNAQTLELFARYLLPNTTSVGYEPLKWQHLSLYENVT